MAGLQIVTKKLKNKRISDQVEEISEVECVRLAVIGISKMIGGRPNGTGDENTTDTTDMACSEYSEVEAMPFVFTSDKEEEMPPFPCVDEAAIDEALSKAKKVKIMKALKMKHHRKRMQLFLRPKRPFNNNIWCLMLAAHKVVYTGKLLVPFWNATVNGHLVGGNLDPSGYLPQDIDLASCKSSKLVNIPHVNEGRQFAVIVFVPQYGEGHPFKNLYRSQLRRLLTIMGSTPCALKIGNHSWGQFFQSGDSGMNEMRMYSPALCEELESMPYLFMTLFKL